MANLGPEQGSSAVCTPEPRRSSAAASGAGGQLSLPYVAAAAAADSGGYRTPLGASSRTGSVVESIRKAKEYAASVVDSEAGTVVGDVATLQD